MFTAPSPGFRGLLQLLQGFWEIKALISEAWPDWLSLLPLFNPLKEMRRRSNEVPQGAEPVPPLGRKVGDCRGAHWVLRMMPRWLLIMLGGRSHSDRLAVPSVSRGAWEKPVLLMFT